MSFSGTTKNELSRIVLEHEGCNLAEMAAFVRMNGTIQLSGMKNINLKFTTENAAIARRIFSLLRSIYDTEVKVMVRRNKQLKKNNNYLFSELESDSNDIRMQGKSLFNKNLISRY